MTTFLFYATITRLEIIPRITDFVCVGWYTPSITPGGFIYEGILVSLSLLIMLHWGVYSDIPVDVLFSPLSNLKYSRWCPRWMPRTTKIINFPFVSYEVWYKCSFYSENNSLGCNYQESSRCSLANYFWLSNWVTSPYSLPRYMHFELQHDIVMFGITLKLS